MPGHARAPGLLVQTAMFAFLSGIALMAILVKPATNASIDDVTAAPESSSKKVCPPGFHLLDNKSCEPCREGVDYTNHSNPLPSCIPCKDCRIDEEEKSPCTVTRDALCQCKPGTFREEESPEICQKCTRCPKGTVEEIPCKPWSDRKCVHKGSDNGGLTAILVSVLVLFGVAVLALVVCLLYKRGVFKSICNCIRINSPDGDGNLDRGFYWCSRTPRGSEDTDNACNEVVSLRNLTPTLDSEQEGERQELVAGVPEEPPQEADHLLAPAAVERSPSKRRKLIPVDGIDPIESIKMCFNSSLDVVPYKSWDKLMREVGLTDNEIDLVKAETPTKNNVLYEMVVKWINKKGRRASINALLDALETLGERCARERIEEYMVNKGKFIYQEDKTDCAVSSE